MFSGRAAVLCFCIAGCIRISIKYLQNTLSKLQKVEIYLL
jgi:hypothetical protein